MPTHTLARAADLVDRLNTDWADLAHSPTGADTLHDWRTREPDLAQAGTLPDLEVLAAAQDTTDVVLGALLRLAHTGDRLAGRTVLQLMLGAAVAIASRTRHHTGGDLEEAKSQAIAALWEAINDYPLHRRQQHHAAGLSLAILNAITGHTDTRTGRTPRQPQLAEIPHGDLTRRLESIPAADPTRADDEQLLELLAWGARRQVITRDEARLLLQLHCPSLSSRTVTAAELADRLGITHAALRQRTSRATRRLATAIHRDRAGQDIRAAVTAA